MAKTITIRDMTKQKKRPSMKDVADLAGVSRTTVSFVLNKVPDANIPQATQERIWTAVKELGYRPNAIAQGLRAQRTNTIGFVSDLVSTTPFSGQVLQGAQDYAWQHKYLLFSINTGGHQDIKDAAINMLLDRQVDGILYAAMYHRQVNPPKAVRDVPTVLLDCFVEDRSLPSVVPDEVTGGYTATRHLLEQGHTRIGFVCDKSDVPAKFGRLEGYRQALTEYGVPYRENYIQTGGSDPFGGYRSTLAMMQQPDPPTALFCYNDRMAMGAYDALRELNLSVPDDIAVIGFDNQELIAAYLHPPLTTLQLPHYEMGQWAVAHLLKLINKQAADSDLKIQHKIACPLIKRVSA